jgi:hypothetical protein
MSWTSLAVWQTELAEIQNITSFVFGGLPGSAHGKWSTITCSKAPKISKGNTLIAFDVFLFLFFDS